MKKEFYKHYIFSGTPREVGQQHGEELRETIHAHLERIYFDAGRMSGLSQKQALEYTRQFEPFVEKYSPDFALELQGLAEGAGLTAQEALLLQIRQEVSHYKRFAAHGQECSCFAVAQSYTKDGKVYSGQNCDLIGDFEPMMNMVTMAVTGKPKVMMILPAGQISHSGMNSEGMSANCTFLNCNGWGMGYPRYLMSRLALEQWTIEDACEKLRIPERSSQRSITLCDAKGAIHMFELTHSEMEERVCHGCAVHTNHFLIPELKRLSSATQWEQHDSEMRCQRMEEMIAANKGKIDREMLKAFLSDHANGNNSICVHSCKENPYHTYVAMINNLTDRVMEVCRGNPCQGEFAIYTFS